jgi:hypothetical protein
MVEERMPIKAGKHQYETSIQYDFIKDTDQYARAAISILGGVKALNSQGARCMFRAQV